MTEKEKFEKAMGLLGEMADTDEEIRDDINENLDMTMREYLESKIASAIHDLQTLPKEVLEKKMSEHIVDTYNEM